LSSVADGLHYLKWGKLGYDPERASGFDVRDMLSAGSEMSDRVAALNRLFTMFEPVPEEWLEKKPKHREKKSDPLTPIDCSDYIVLATAWRKAMRWTVGLDHALTVMLASVASTKSVGDQLWVKVIGPAACGKSTLCEAVSTNTDYVLAKSTIRGFHSGFREEGKGSEEDHSLVALLYDKTLVTKDGDTLLQSPNLGQILSEARDLYDSTSRTHYRNAMSRDYQGVRMTWILCGTSSLRAIDSSELGERFLDCVIMDSIDDELEDEVLWRVANRADRNLSIEAGDDAANYEPELAQAMRLTGGYVSWLRENATEELGKIENPDWAKRKCTRLGKFVAHMRARPSTRQEETAEREFAARLVSQLIRLAKCLALVLNRKSVDEEVMRRVKRVALDTSRGQTLSICHNLFNAGTTGMEVRTIALLITRTEEKTKVLLRFLKLIGVVEHYIPEVEKGHGRPHWRLTSRMARLFKDAYTEHLPE
jgi:hypothetical protein